MSERSPQEAIQKHEPFAIFVAGLAVLVGGGVAVLNDQMSLTVHGVLMVVWIGWFVKWTSQGGFRGLGR